MWVQMNEAGFWQIINGLLPFHPLLLPFSAHSVLLTWCQSCSPDGVGCPNSFWNGRVWWSGRAGPSHWGQRGTWALKYLPVAWEWWMKWLQNQMKWENSNIGCSLAYSTLWCCTPTPLMACDHWGEAQENGLKWELGLGQYPMRQGWECLGIWHNVISTTVSTKFTSKCG